MSRKDDSLLFDLALDFDIMRKNLPVFPHRRAGFAGAAALFPADWIYEMFSWPRLGDREAGWGRPE
jgi:hypothetical protein